MGFRDFLADSVRGGLIDTVWTAIAKRLTGDVPPFWGQTAIGQELWSDWDYEKAVRKYFRGNELIARCLRIRANAESSIPIQAKRLLPDGTLTDLPATHGAVKFARKPNPRLSWRDIMYRLSFARDLKGAIVWKINNVNAQAGLIEIWPLRPDLVRPRPVNTTELEYVYKPGFGVEAKVYKAEEIVHIVQYDPINEYTGIATLRPAQRRADVADSIRDAQKFSFDNMVLPSGIISGDLSPKQAEEIKDQIVKTKRGPKNFRKMLLARTRVFFQSLMGSPAEMDFTGSGESTDRKLTLGLGIHPVLLGVADATFENQQMAEVFLWTNETIPNARAALSAINIQLAPLFGDDVVFVHDLSQSPPIIEMRRQNARIAKYYLEMGINVRAINIALDLGLPSWACPDTGFMQAGMLPLGNTSQAGRSIQQRAINTDEDSIDARWVLRYRVKQAYEEAMGKNVSRRFLEEGELIESEWLAGNQNYEVLIQGEAEAWRIVLAASWRVALKRIGEDTEAEILGGERASLRFDAYTGAINSFVEQHVATQVDKIQAETIARVKRVVDAAALEGASAVDTARQLHGLYKRFGGKDPELPFDKSRSMKIARTEIHGASGFGSREAAIQTGVVTGKRWISARAGNIRDSHKALDDGTIYALNATYPNGLMYPGDPSGSAKETVNCICQELYETGPDAEQPNGGES